MIVKDFLPKGYRIMLYNLYTLHPAPAAIWLISGVWTTGKMTCAGGEDLFATHLAPHTRMCHSKHWRITVSAFISLFPLKLCILSKNHMAVYSMCNHPGFLVNSKLVLSVSAHLKLKLIQYFIDRTLFKSRIALLSTIIYMNVRHGGHNTCFLSLQPQRKRRA